MVKQRQEEGVAYKNIALSRLKLSNSLEAALAENREDEADILREKLAKVGFAWLGLAFSCVSTDMYLFFRVGKPRQKQRIFGWHLLLSIRVT